MHEYQRRVALAQKEPGWPSGPWVGVDVEHDDDCGWFEDQECDCDPGIVVYDVLEDTMLRIDKNGKLTPYVESEGN